MTVPNVPMTEPEPIQRTIARIRRSGKWVEFWFVENEGDFSRSFDACEKAGYLHELLEQDGNEAAAEWVDNHGYAGLITTWRGQKLIRVHLPFSAVPSPGLSDEDLWNLARRMDRLVKAKEEAVENSLWRHRVWRRPNHEGVASVLDRGGATPFPENARLLLSPPPRFSFWVIAGKSTDWPGDWESAVAHVEKQLQSLGYTILKETPCP